MNQEFLDTPIQIGDDEQTEADRRITGDLKGHAEFFRSFEN